VCCFFFFFFFFFSSRRRHTRSYGDWSSDVCSSDLFAGGTVEIAGGLVNRPKILLADEPTGNLDSATGESILTLLREIQENPGMTIVMVTHERILAERFADRLAVMGDGKLLSNGAAR